MSQPKPWSFSVVENHAGGGQTANVFISGPIYDGESYGTELAGAGDLVNQISGLESHVDNIDVTIQSPGGSISAGLAIYNALINSGKFVTTHVAGMAASMGSVIMQAGDVRKMPRNSFQMVHRAQGGASGTADDVAAAANVIQQHEDELVDIYARRTGKTSAEVREMISTDNYMNANSCVENGLADQVIEPPSQSDAESDETSARLTPDNLKFMAENRMAIPSLALLPINLIAAVDPAPSVDPEVTETPEVDPAQASEPSEPETTEEVDPAASLEPSEPESETPAPPKNLAARLFAYLAGNPDTNEVSDQLKNLVTDAGLQATEATEIVDLQLEVDDLENRLQSYIDEKSQLENQIENLKAEAVTVENAAAKAIAKLGFVGADLQALEAVPPISAEEASPEAEIDSLRGQLKTEKDPRRKAELAREIKALR